MPATPSSDQVESAICGPIVTEKIDNHCNAAVPVCVVGRGGGESDDTDRRERGGRGTDAHYVIEIWRGMDIR